MLYINTTASIASCFEGVEFDYVFNFAAETKYSQVKEVYQDRIFNLSVNCAKEAAKHKVKVFIEMSTAEVYESNTVSLRKCIGFHFKKVTFLQRNLQKKHQRSSHGL